MTVLTALVGVSVLVGILIMFDGNVVFGLSLFILGLLVWRDLDLYNQAPPLQAEVADLKEQLGSCQGAVDTILRVDPETPTNPRCGNGRVEVGEQCDGNDFQGYTCSKMGLGRGVLSCEPDYCTFDTHQCGGVQ